MNCHLISITIHDGPLPIQHTCPCNTSVSQSKAMANNNQKLHQPLTKYLVVHEDSRQIGSCCRMSQSPANRATAETCFHAGAVNRFRMPMIQALANSSTGAVTRPFPCTPMICISGTDFLKVSSESNSACHVFHACHVHTPFAPIPAEKLKFEANFQAFKHAMPILHVCANAF